MCPLYPLHLIFSWGFLLLFLWVSFGQSLVSALGNSSAHVTLSLILGNSTHQIIDINEGDEKNVTFYIEDLPPDAVGEIVRIKEESEDGLTHLQLSQDSFPVEYDPVSGKSEANTVVVSGLFLGFSKLKFVLSSDKKGDEYVQRTQEVKVHRETSTLDIIFIHVVVGLVLIAYVNMGCAIDLDAIKETVKRPVSLAIGLASQYLFMPLVSYGLGWLLFSSRPELWLGLFLTGASPGGGGSNMWTYILGGSLDLSITMTFLSTVFAFAALPLWVYALGPSIFPDGYYGRLPYRNIAALVLGLVIPVCIGLGIRRFCPRGADVLKRLLKPVSVLFIGFIMTFGVYAKLYLFSFFNWQVVVAGFCLPFFGFVFGGSMAVLLKRKSEEIIAISIETGVQNSGLAIGVLKIALGSFSPMEDIAIVLPVAVATMTPLPLFITFIVKYIRDKREPKMIALTDNCSNCSVEVCNAGFGKDSNGNARKDMA